MFESILIRMRRLVIEQAYIVPIHATDEMEAENLIVYDLERIVLTGTIVERQKDAKSGQYKYRITGRATDGSAAEVVARISLVNKVVFITVYSLER